MRCGGWGGPTRRFAKLFRSRKGTLAGWCSEIRLSAEQIEGIKARRPPGVRSDVPIDRGRKRREEVEQIRSDAYLFARSHLSDPFWVAGTCLYWAEGSKTKRSFEMANSDPRLLRFFIAWVRAYHDCEARFVLGLHLHEGNDDQAARRFWSEALGLPGAEFHKTFIKPKGTGHRKNHLPHGVCRVRVRKSVDAWIRTMAWIDVVAQELPRRSLLSCLPGRWRN